MPTNPSPNAPSSSSPLPWTATWAALLSTAALLSLFETWATHGLRGGFVGTLTLLVCALAGLFDAWTRRIPNRLTYAAILAGLALNALAGLCERLGTGHADAALRWLSAAGPAQSVSGFAVCAALGIVGFVVARVGGGDVKLLVALGALLGLSQMVDVLFAALSVAVIYALLNLAIAGRLNLALRLAACRLLELLYLRTLAFDDPESTDKALTIPMAVPLALGVAIAQLIDLRALIGGHP